MGDGDSIAETTSAKEDRSPTAFRGKPLDCFDLAKARREDSEKFAWHCTVAYRENQIMEKYFAKTLYHSSYGWPEETTAFVRKFFIEDHVYDSRVSKNLLTSVTEGQAIGFFACLLAGLILLDIYAGRRQHVTSSQ